MKYFVFSIKILTLAIVISFLFPMLNTRYQILDTGSVHAQEAIRVYTIMPPTVTQKLNPGQSAEGVLGIINGTNNGLTFTVSVKDFIVEDTIGTPKFLPTNTLSNKYSAASWIRVTPSTFTIEPHQKQQLNYSIDIPPNARPGGHYAAVIYAPNAGIMMGGTDTTVNTEAGSLFYVEVNGSINEQVSITKFFANPFQEYGPVNILTQLKNLGDLHAAPKGTITVSGLFFNQTQDLPTHNIFPEAARDFSNTFGKSLMVGRYKATLIGSYGASNNLPLVATVYFWVFPWRVTLVIVLTAVALILGGMYVRKRKKDGSNKPTEAETEVVVPSTETPEVK
jgi:hypothetical protein